MPVLTFMSFASCLPAAVTGPFPSILGLGGTKARMVWTLESDEEKNNEIDHRH